MLKYHTDNYVHSIKPLHKSIETEKKSEYSVHKYES